MLCNKQLRPNVGMVLGFLLAPYTLRYLTEKEKIPTELLIRIGFVSKDRKYKAGWNLAEFLRGTTIATTVLVMSL